jgi:hypothetical protein
METKFANLSNASHALLKAINHLRPAQMDRFTGSVTTKIRVEMNKNLMVQTGRFIAANPSG